MRVALVDPSLFTLPYDVALARGLMHAGCTVVLHCRPLEESDGSANGICLKTHFYPVAESLFARRLPKKLQLAIKGIDHFASMQRLLSLLQAERPDIIHFQWMPLPVVDSRMLARLRRIAPLVLTVHDTDPFNGNPAARVQRLGIDKALRGVDRLIVHTIQGRERLLALNITPEKIVILPHGSLSRKQIGTGGTMEGKLTLLLFGKIKPYKGADLLIEAFAALPPALRAQAQIRIVGKPYMPLDGLFAQAESLGIATSVSVESHFIPDDDIDALFGPETIAVFPYREIEASGVLSYAITNGRPIIASAIGSFAETLIDGVHGRLVPPANVPALSEAIAEVISNRGQTAHFATAVSGLALKIPSWEAIGTQTRLLYTSLA